MDTVHFFQGDDGEWRWHRKSENGRVVSDSAEGYNSLQDCADQAVMQFGQSVEYVNDEE